MKSIEQERQKLIAEKEGIQNAIEEEIADLRSRYKERLTILDAKIEFATELLSDEVSAHSESPLDTSKNGKSNSNPFTVVGSMPIREAAIKVLREANHAMDMDKLMPALQKLGIISSRKSVRSRLTKMVGKDIERVEEGTYRLIEK